MTDKALAERLRKLAQAYRSVVVVDVTLINEATDLDRAADLIEKMAQPEPIATVYYPRTGGNVGVSWRAIPETGAMPPEGAKLYLAPPAQRVPLSDEQIRALVQPMDWPPSVTEIVRAVEQAVWEKNDD